MRHHNSPVIPASATAVTAPSDRRLGASMMPKPFHTFPAIPQDAGNDAKHAAKFERSPQTQFLAYWVNSPSLGTCRPPAIAPGLSCARWELFWEFSSPVFLFGALLLVLLLQVWCRERTRQSSRPLPRLQLQRLAQSSTMGVSSKRDMVITECEVL